MMTSTKTVHDSDETATVLLQLVQNLAVELNPRDPRRRAVNLDSSLDTDLGFDSLARMELLSRLEREFGLDLPEHLFASAETPGDLLRALVNARRFGVALVSATLGQPKPDEAAAAPDSAKTLVDVLDWHAQIHPDRPHLRLYSDTDEGEVITYSQLRERARTVAAGLQNSGVGPGTVVTIMLPTGPDYFLSFFGILMAGGIPVPIYPPARRAQLENHLRRQTAVLRNCRATMLITEPDAKRIAQLLTAQVETLGRVATVAELSDRGMRYEAPVIRADDIAFLQYTSGSTGNPKGVMLTHANLLANVRADGEALQAKPNDVFVSWLPLYHDMGLIGAWLGSLYFAISLVIMSPLAFLGRPQRWLWAIHRYGGTLSAAPNFGYELCLRRVGERDIEGLDLSSWRVAANGAEPVSPETVHRFCARFSRYGFRLESMLPVYGLAECSVGLAFSPLNRGPIVDRIQREPLMRDGLAKPAKDSDTNACRFVACGQPLPGHQIRIVDPSGRELPERQEGRIQFRGPSATSGYFRNSEETRRLFDNHWLNTGDLGYTARGDLYITGRSKDIIIRAGCNIYPEELEDAVGEIDAVRKGGVAVFGSTDPRSGTERLVVLAETRKQDPEVYDQLRSQIATLITDLIGTPPDEVVLAPPNTILKTSSGKIRRAASREVYEQGRIGQKQKPVWWQVTRLALTGFVPQLRGIKRSAARTLYAACGWALLGLLAPVTWVLVVATPFPTWRWAIMRAGSRLLVFASGTQLIVRGLEHLLAPDRACILVSNHASYLDGTILIAALPRGYSFIAKAELSKQFVAGTFLRRIDAVFVERFDREQVLQDAQRLKHAVLAGRSLLFFAEGTFKRMPGLLPFRLGAFTTAVETGMPVVPIAIRGSRSILRPGSWFPRHGAVTVTIGEPINVATAKIKSAGDPWGAAVWLRDAARRQILRYCGEPSVEATLLSAEQTR